MTYNLKSSIKIIPHLSEFMKIIERQSSSINTIGVSINDQGIDLTIGRDVCHLDANIFDVYEIVVGRIFHLSVETILAIYHSLAGADERDVVMFYDDDVFKIVTIIGGFITVFDLQKNEDVEAKRRRII